MDFMPPVVVKLVGDIKDFQSKMDQAERQMGVASGGIGRSMGMIGVAAGVAGAAVATFATKLAVDGVQAAIEDEKAATRLAVTMKNLGLAHDTAPIEATIDAMQRQYGVADDALRPAMEKLVRVTKDSDEAVRLLKIAMDLGAGSGKGLEAASTALAKAAGGQTTALRRLAPELDANVLATKNLDLITKEISSTYGGQAKAAAATYEGMLKRLGVGFSELQESFGYGFLNALGNAQGGTDDLMNSMKDLQPIVELLGGAIGDLANDAGTTVSFFGSMQRALKKLQDQLDINTDSTNSAIRGNERLEDTAMRALNPYEQGVYVFEQLTGYMDRWTESGIYATDAQLALSSASRHAATAAEASVGPLGDQESALLGVADAAAEAQARVLQTVLATNALGLSHEHAARNEKVTGTISLELTRTIMKMRDAANSASGSVRGLGDSAAAAAEDIQPIGVMITDGLIESLNISAKKLPAAAQGQIDKLVQGYNQAVEASRTYMAGISKALVDSLDFSAAADMASKTGASIVDEFVAQSKRITKFGENMRALLSAGLNESSWNEIYSMNADKGAAIADALIEGNMAENVRRVNEVVGSVKLVGEKVGQQATATFMKAGEDSALGYLKKFIDEIMPEGKQYKKVMEALNNLAAASNRTATITVATVYTGGGSVPISENPEDYAAPAPVFDIPDLSTWMPVFADGGWVDRTGPAFMHANEFVLSAAMLAGREPVPAVVKQAMEPAKGQTSITVNARTNADPVEISREIAWNLRVGML